LVKYIFITGGVVSSIGKGITASALGLLLQQRGYRVTIQKFDPYINVDPGTMNPFQHGEVYVTEDGAETDLDLGHYERFLGINMNRANNTTSGQIYYDVITRERQGEYLGATVQVIPHITDETKIRMCKLGDSGNYDIVIIEIGGTIGDIESLPFIEAVRQLLQEFGKRNAICIHVTYVPYIKSAQELKTKPTQHSVKALLELGIQPDMLVCRSERSLSLETRAKIASFCNVDPNSVFSTHDLETIYEIPLLLHSEKIDKLILGKLKLPDPKIDLALWKKFVSNVKNPSEKIEIAICGKYIEYRDAYKSIVEAFVHAGAENDVKVSIRWVNAEDCEEGDLNEFFAGVSGILVPGGFGVRGIEGKINAVNYARVNKIPFLGICLGMQCAVIEFARNVCNLPKANSSEFKKGAYSVIDLMPGQKGIKNMGGSMRLGSYNCRLKKNTKAAEAYQEVNVNERHRHRYELNNQFRELLVEKGLVISGTSPDEQLVEIIELKDHPWFVGCQFHPELKSRATRSHPLFREFVKASKAFAFAE